MKNSANKLRNHFENFPIQNEIADNFFENEFYEIEDKCLVTFNSSYSVLYDLYVSGTVKAL